MTFTVVEWLMTNFRNLSIFKTIVKVRVCDFGQNLKMTQTSYFCSIHHRTLVNHGYNWVDHLDCLSHFCCEWRQTSKLVRVYDFGQNLKMNKTFQFFSFHEENTCKSCLHSNLIILTDFHSFTVNEDILQS